MTSSPRTSFLSEIAAGDAIPHVALAYFQERQRNRIYNFILTKFFEKERAGSLTRAELARRIQRSPAQISRWLGAPGNWTFDTASDLMLGICGAEIGFSELPLLDRAARNDTQPEWLSEPVRVSPGQMITLSKTSGSSSTSTVRIEAGG